MRLLDYLNESSEDKVFAAIDDFMATNDIAADKLTDDKTFKELIIHLGETFQIDSIKILPTNNTQLSGESSVEGIIVHIPRSIKMDKKFKINILGVLLHEMSHMLLRSKTDPFFQLGYYSPGTNSDFYQFSKYVVQRIERPAQAVSSAIVAIVAGWDIVKDFDYIEEQGKKVKNLKEINDLCHSVLNKLDGLPYEKIMFNSLILTCGFVSSMYLQIPDDPDEAKRIKPLIREVENKWKRFRHNLDNSYKKFHAYFKRYNIL